MERLKQRATHYMIWNDGIGLLRSPGHVPVLRSPRLPSAITGFPITKAIHSWIYRGRLEDHEAFRRVVERHVRAETIVLDVGAGRGAGPVLNIRGKVARVIGVDPSRDIRKNPGLDEWHVGDAQAMPFLQDASVDLAYARYVAEHLQEPLLTLTELRRVLKPGGHFLFITPNRRHYVPSIARGLPTLVHKAVNAARGRASEDTFRTVYALNSPSDIHALGVRAGFSRVEVFLFESQPDYLTFHPLLFLAGVAYERAVNSVDALAPFRGSIVARLTA